MKTLDLLHRWTGGLIGVLLALLGLSGAILVHKDAWVRLPGADDALQRDVGAIVAATERAMAGAPRPGGIIYARETFGLHTVRYEEGVGAYIDQSGRVVASWTSLWERPELWLFDFHHHLFAGDTGEAVAGVAGLCALFFVISGAILWWRTKRTFALRLWPRRMIRPAIVTHHRDLGIVVAPLLFLSALTGAMMVFRPVALFVLSPFSPPAAIEATLTAPKLSSRPLAAAPDWAAMLTTANARFPDADFRILALPRKAGDPISLRMKQREEWLPNGRTILWFDAATGEPLASRDALAMPLGARMFNAVYPLHAAKVGGFAYRLVMTVSGLALALLGSLAVWSFWFQRRPKAAPRNAAAQAVPGA